MTLRQAVKRTLEEMATAPYFLIIWPEEESVSVVPQGNVLGGSKKGDDCMVKMGRSKFAGKILEFGEKQEMERLEGKYINGEWGPEQPAKQPAEQPASKPEDEDTDDSEQSKEPPGGKGKNRPKRKGKVARTTKGGGSRGKTSKEGGAKRAKGSAATDTKEGGAKKEINKEGAKTSTKKTKKPGNILTISKHGVLPSCSTTTTPASSSTTITTAVSKAFVIAKANSPLSISSGVSDTDSLTSVSGSEEEVKLLTSDEGEESLKEDSDMDTGLSLETGLLDVELRMQKVEETQQQILQQLQQLSHQVMFWPPHFPSFPSSSTPYPNFPPSYPSSTPTSYSNFPPSFPPSSIPYLPLTSPSPISPPSVLQPPSTTPSTPKRPRRAADCGASPLPLKKLPTNALQSSDIDEQGLISVEKVLEKYPSYKGESNAGRLACKLAKEAFFGVDVMKRCTPVGNRELPGLPTKELFKLKKAMFMQFPQYWRSPAEFEPVWTSCLEAVQQNCKRIRQNKEQPPRK